MDKKTDFNSFAENIPLEEIKTFFSLQDINQVNINHYHAAFDLSRQDNFAVNILKNDADSFALFIDDLDKKYIVNGQNDVVVDPNYHPRVRRDTANQNAAARDMIKLIYGMSRM